MAVLDISNLSKSYGKVQALDQLNLSVEAGQIFGILGPNGSGKTTTLGIILGIIMSDSGSYNWFGEPGSSAQRRRVGAILETPNFYTHMSASDNLKLVAHIKRIENPDINGILRTVGLLERASSAFKTYSLGMKQRLAIGACLLGDPEVLIFDEPTNGLDPQGMAEVRELLRNIGQQGKTILLASHIIDEVEKVCTHAAIIKRGKLLASGMVSELLSGEQMVEVSASNIEQLSRSLQSSPLVKSLRQDSGKLICAVNDGVSTEDLNRYAQQQGIVLNHLTARKKSLEQEFLERTS